MTGPQEEIAALYSLLAAHNPAALEYLYDYAPRLELALRQRFGTRIAGEDIKDIVRDTLVRALETGERFDPACAQLATWLNMLAHFQALDFLRRQHPTVPLDGDWSELACSEPEEHEEETQPSPRFERLLSQLSPRRSMVVLMHYYEHYSTLEIARLLHISHAAVKSHLSHARKDLREALTATGVSQGA